MKDMRSIYLALLILLLIISHSIIVRSWSGYVVVYGIEMCGECRLMKEFFEENGISYEFRSLMNSTYSRDLNRIAGFLAKDLGGRPEDYIIVPVNIVYSSSGEPIAIVIGYVGDRGFWEKVFSTSSSSIVYVYIADKRYSVNDQELYSFLIEIKGSHVSQGVSGYAILPFMIGLAAADSINPCAISTTVLLAVTSASIGFIGRSRYLLVSSFIAGVYLGYLLLGLLVSIIIQIFTYLLVVVLALALAVVIKDLVSTIRRKEISIECTGRECLPGFTSKLPRPLIPLGLLGFGIVVSWTFMSCSAAPYFIFLSYITMNVPDTGMRIFYMMLYCLIIIAPLILVSLIPVEKVLGFRRIGKVILVKDILLTMIVVYLAIQLLQQTGFI